MLSPAALLATVASMLLGMTPFSAESGFLANDWSKARSSRAIAKPKPRIVKTPCAEQVKQQRRYILM